MAFTAPNWQRGAMQLMLRSIAAGDRKGLDAGFRVIDATFRAPNRDRPFCPRRRTSGRSFCRGFLALRTRSGGARAPRERICRGIQRSDRQTAPKSTKPPAGWPQEKYQERFKREDAENTQPVACSTAWPSAFPASWPTTKSCAN